jgi:hypothetical protein
LFWDVIKRAFPAEQLLPSLNLLDLLNPKQLTVYNLIVDHYRDYLAGRNPPQLRVNLDGVAGTGKTYVLLQASKKVEDMATIAGRKDPVCTRLRQGSQLTTFTAARYIAYSTFR